MLAFYIWSAVLGGGTVLVSLLSSLASHHDADHGGEHDHDAHAGHDLHAGHDAHIHDVHVHDVHVHDVHVHDVHDGHFDPAADHGADAQEVPAAGTPGSPDPRAAAGAAGAEDDADAHDAAHSPHALAPHPEAQHAGSGDLGALAFLRYLRPASHFAAGFGVTGLITTAAGFLEPITGTVAAVTGAVTLLAGRKIASSLRAHEATSSVEEEDLLGREAEVIIRVGPGAASGTVRAAIKGSAPEFVAVSAHPNLVLEVGEKVYIVEQLRDGAVKVDRQL